MSPFVAPLLLALLGLTLSPYLAGLTLSVPDRADTRWWFPRRPSGRRTLATALAAVLLGAVAGAAAGWGPLLPAFAVLALCGATLTVIDAERHRLPDRLVLVAGAGAAVGLTGAAVAGRHWRELGGSAAGAAAVGAVLLAVASSSPRSLGLGDVKLAAVLGAYLGWFGWTCVLGGVALAFVLGAAFALGAVLVGRASWRSSLPFGPMLLLGTLVALADPGLLAGGPVPGG